MAIDKGNIKTSANYDVKAQKPLDGRAVRPTKADLIKKESWSSDGNTVYVYEGMQVYVEAEKKTYYLKDLSKIFASDFSGWELMGTGAGSGITEEKEVYIGSDEPPVGAKVWIDPTGTPSQPSAGVEVIDNLESDSTTAALSANQGRVLKGMIGQGGYYILPQGVINAYQTSPYVFTSAEVADFNSHKDMYGVKVMAQLNESSPHLCSMSEAHAGAMHAWQFVLYEKKPSSPPLLVHLYEVLVQQSEDSIVGMTVHQSYEVNNLKTYYGND